MLVLEFVINGGGLHMRMVLVMLVGVLLSELRSVFFHMLLETIILLSFILVLVL